MFREDRKNCAATRRGGVLLYVRESLFPGESYGRVTKFSGKCLVHILKEKGRGVVGWSML